MSGWWHHLTPGEQIVLALIFAAFLSLMFGEWFMGLMATGLTGAFLVLYGVTCAFVDERRDRQARRRSEYGATSLGWVLVPLAGIGFVLVWCWLTARGMS